MKKLPFRNIFYKHLTYELVEEMLDSVDLPAPDIVDEGIGNYEYWGSPGFDSRLVAEADPVDVGILEVWGSGVSPEDLEDILKEIPPQQTSTDDYTVEWRPEATIYNSSHSYIAILRWEARQC